MFENISSSINFKAVSMDNFLKSNKLTRVEAPNIMSDVSFLKNKVLYVLYGLNNNSPRLERITFDHFGDDFYRYELRFPIMGVAYSYRKSSTLEINYYPEEEVEFKLLDTIDDIVYKAQKQICPEAPYMVRGFYFDGGVVNDYNVSLSSKTISRNFGLIFFKEEGLL